MSSRKLDIKSPSEIKNTSFRVLSNSSLSFNRTAVFQIASVVGKEERMWVKKMANKT